jgi:hypothetical protein
MSGVPIGHSHGFSSNVPSGCDPYKVRRFLATPRKSNFVFPLRRHCTTVTLLTSEGVWAMIRPAEFRGPTRKSNVGPSTFWRIIIPCNELLDIFSS